MQYMNSSPVMTMILQPDFTPPPPRMITYMVSQPRSPPSYQRCYKDKCKLSFHSSTCILNGNVIARMLNGSLISWSWSFMQDFIPATILPSSSSFSPAILAFYKIDRPSPYNGYPICSASVLFHTELGMTKFALALTLPRGLVLTTDHLGNHGTRPWCVVHVSIQLKTIRLQFNRVATRRHHLLRRGVTHTHILNACTIRQLRLHGRLIESRWSKPLR